MGTILPFPRPEQRSQTAEGGPRATGANARPAEIVIFPGVRIERHRDSDVAPDRREGPLRPVRAE